MNSEQKFWTAVTVVLLAPLPIGAWAFGQLAVGWWWGETRPKISLTQVAAQSTALPKTGGMVRLAGGLTQMGSTLDAPADWLPAHEVQLDPFWVDTHPVTNNDFARFVTETGYKTTAQQRGSSLVFDYDRRKWNEVHGAAWNTPLGPRSTLVARDDFPVVHVSWYDATAYAEWAGKRLLSEAEYELAARGGLLDAPYAWGDQPPTEELPQANYWQGRFPTRDLGLDGVRGLAAVGQYPPNRFGLYDMAGNAWCWCNDWYGDEYYVASQYRNPRGPATTQHRVMRGGSYLSTGGDDSELRVAARGHMPPHHTASNVGFRCASSQRPAEKPAEQSAASSAELANAASPDIASQRR